VYAVTTPWVAQAARSAGLISGGLAVRVRPSPPRRSAWQRSADLFVHPRRIGGLALTPGASRGMAG
jgi:hypothetical protein